MNTPFTRGYHFNFNSNVCFMLLLFSVDIIICSATFHFHGSCLKAEYLLIASPRCTRTVWDCNLNKPSSLLSFNRDLQHPRPNLLHR
jgi:hypothetical protein